MACRQGACLFINIECPLHTTFLHEMLSIFIFSKVVEEVLWCLTLIHRDIFVADTTMAEMVSDIPALACFGQERTLPRFLKYLYP